MKIGILSFRPGNKRFTRQELRLAEEAKKRGHSVQMLRIQNCMMLFSEKGEMDLRYGRKIFPSLDLVIPRAGTSENVVNKSAAIEQLQLMGIPMLNSYQAILRAKNKLHTLQILSSSRIPIVKTVVIHHQQYLDEALKHLASFPLVMKAITGAGGRSVAIVESKRSLQSAYDFIKEKYDTGNAMLLQEYIPEADGKDIRLFVVGGKVIAAMERIAKEGEFRSNIHQGGIGRAYQPSSSEKHLAVRAAKAIGLQVAGVDVIQTKHGPAVMEVNANPGFEALEKVTGVNVAEAIIKYARKFVQEYVPREW